MMRKRTQNSSEICGKRKGGFSESFSVSPEYTRVAETTPMNP
jgi:hypothetical protein